MNVTELTKTLHEKINTAASTQEVLALSKAIERLNIGSVNTVDTYISLLNLYPQQGEIYFVEDEEKLYYATGTSWVSIFGTADGIAYSWGYAFRGRLGDDTTANKSSPVSVVGGFTNWIQVSAGRDHSLGVRANGTMWAWGTAQFGPLGDNSTTDRSSPVSVVGGFNWIQASAGSSFSLGLRSNGTLWAWGVGDQGQRGDNRATNDVSSPVSVVGGFADWIQVSAGDDHSLGLRANGTLWAWGSGQSGRLGNNSTVSRSSPVSVVGGFIDWIQAAAGQQHCLGVRANGTLWAWGDGSSGVLGDNTQTDKSSPVSVIGGFTDWVQVSASAATANPHSIAVRSNGTLWAWGQNTDGRLGDNSTTNRSSPVSVVGGFTDWVQVSAGGTFNLGLRANGTLWAWGNNTNGRLGSGDTTPTLSPVSVVGGFTDWVQVSAGYKHSIGIRIQ